MNDYREIRVLLITFDTLYSVHLHGEQTELGIFGEDLLSDLARVKYKVNPGHFVLGFESSPHHLSAAQLRTSHFRFLCSGLPSIKWALLPRDLPRRIVGGTKPAHRAWRCATVGVNVALKQFLVLNLHPFLPRFQYSMSLPLT